MKYYDIGSISEFLSKIKGSIRVIYMTVLVQKALMQYLKGIYLNTFVGYRNMSVILFQYIE
ncbi:hypothetical protein TXYLGN1_30060 [Tepidimicrobium xylanilyticum]